MIIDLIKIIPTVSAPEEIEEDAGKLPLLCQDAKSQLKGADFPWQESKVQNKVVPSGLYIIQDILEIRGFYC